MELSPTRESFRAALARVRRYSVDTVDRLPAFMSPVEAFRSPPRRPLPDLPAPPARVLSQELTVARAMRQMAEGSLTAVELARQSLEAIARRNQELNAFVHILPEDEYLAQAEQLDRERRGGALRGPLHGIPISVKDIIAVADMPYTASSRVREGVVADADAASVQLLRKAGAIIMGKTQTHEFALGVSTPQSRNPHDITRDPGGSSGGSAITVATGMSLASLGTDTRASIRVPPALCGVVGYKATFGLVPTTGVTMLSWSLDHVAPIVRTVEDAAILLNVLAVGGSAVAGKREDYTTYLAKDVRNLRVGVPVNALIDADPEVIRLFREACRAFRTAGVEVVDTDIPSAEDFDMANVTGLIVSRCEAANYHRSFNVDSSLYTRPVFEQLDEASQVQAVDYIQAQRFRAEFRERMLEHLDQFDALLMPTCRVPAPKTTEVEQFFLVLSLNCIPWSFIGFPATSIPCGLTSGGLPVGAELVSGPMEDGRLLALASALESALESKSN